MKIKLKKINEKLKYNNLKIKYESGEIIISTLEDLYQLLFAESYDANKCLKSFISLIENNKNLINNKETFYFLDYSNYLNLYQIFKSEKELLYYVQDTCEARGERIPKNIEEAILYLEDENIYLNKIQFEDINENELKNKYLRS